MSSKIIFYTLIYKIKSKFNFDKYLEWGKNLLENLKNEIFIIYTDNYTYQFIEPLINNYKNIQIIFLEIQDFEYYKYLDFLNNCTKLTEGYNIDPKLLLIWLERVIILKKIRESIRSDFYSYVDFGYFRDNKIYNNFLKNNIILNNDKIYYCLIFNDILYIKDLLLFYDLNKEMPVKNDGMIGGGFFIIHYNKIDFYLNLFDNKIKFYINNNKLIKDDQIIITDVILDKNNINHFELITEYDSHLNVIYNNKINKNINFKDFIISIYYFNLLFKNKKKENFICDYLYVNNDYYSIENFDEIINIKPTDQWFVFKNFLNDINYNDYIMHNYKPLFFNYYLIDENDCNINHDVYYENDLIKVFKKDNGVYITFKYFIGFIDYNILYKLYHIFININVLNINKISNHYNNEIIIQLSEIFKFKITKQY